MPEHSDGVFGDWLWLPENWLVNPGDRLWKTGDKYRYLDTGSGYLRLTLDPVLTAILHS